MVKRNWQYLLLLFVILDSVYSFWQHLHVALDGDMAAIILPGPWYQQVLEDPFGLRVLLKNEVYAAPNRFFAHQLMSSYFKTVPLLLQHWFSPIDSLYQACAWLKIAIQLLLIYLLGVYSSGSYRVLSKRFLLTAALIVPLFQTTGFNGQMGIIDKSITYTVFYALPLGLLLIFFLPFYRAAFRGTQLRLSGVGIVFLLLLAIVLSFNGPLVPGVVALVCPGALGLMAWHHFKARPDLPAGSRLWRAVRSLPKSMVLVFGFISVLCLYSLYIGRNNAENLEGETVPLLERYSRLPLGLYKQLARRPGLPLLVLINLLNAYAIKRLPVTAEGKKLLTILQWLGWFALVYILLLPLGGYRPYRPNIVRRDVILPITLGLIYFYASSTYYLLRYLPTTYRPRYLMGIAVFLVTFTLLDRPTVGDNTCERNLMNQLAQAPEKVVRLSAACSLMSWSNITNQTESEINAQLFYYWHITNEKKQYVQETGAW